MTDIAITELLAGLGLTGEPATRARAIHEDAGVTNARKQGCLRTIMEALPKPL